MNHRERIVIYGLLSALLLVTGLLLLDRSGPAAHAAPFAFDDILGPADGVELRGGDDDAKAIVLRNSDGRPAWGDDAWHRAHSRAYVHIGRILNRQLAADIYEEERAALREEAEVKDGDYATRLNELNDRLRGLDRESPEAQEIMQQGNTLLQEYRQWQQQVLARQDQLGAQHLEQAYRELVSAVKVVADRMDIDIVERFIPTDEPFDAVGAEQATLAIRLRQLLHYPADLDITREVMQELALEFE
jgi:Skp family chaperone for outer membrane proteins